MINNGLIKQWMSSPVITVSPDTTLREAREILSEEKIRALPVIKNRKLVGIITRRGLLRLDLSFLADESWHQQARLEQEKVSEVMTVSPLTTRPDSLMPKAARIMLENKITALPVIEKGALVGILTNSDFLRFIIQEYSSLKKVIKVSNYMTDEVVTIERDTNMLEIHRLMGVKRIRSLPVMEGDQLVGIVTRTDLMSSDPSRLTSSEDKDLSLKILTQPVEKIMSNPVITISPDAVLTEAAQLMLDNKLHSLPVVDENKKLVGIITESDLFLMIVQKFF
jgi:CBS domain-containing protein